MKSNKIEVVAYQPEWPHQFEQIKKVLEDSIMPYIMRIEHVGSTSVQGLAAKPIIDLDIVIAEKKDLVPIIEELGCLGYHHVGDLGIVGREAFKPRSEASPDDGSGTIWPPHHLYVCLQNNLGLRNHLALRGYLRNHPAAKNKYSELKMNLARQFPHDMDRYIAGKTTFITNILQKCGFADPEIEKIKTQNEI